VWSMKVKFRRGCWYDVRRSSEVVSVLESAADRVADAANGLSGAGDGGYMTGSRQGRRAPQGRWRTSVVTASAAAMVDDARNNTLLKSLDAGRI